MSEAQTFTRKQIELKKQEVLAKESELQALKTEYKHMKGNVHKRAGSSKPNGITAPRLLKPEACDFFKVPHGTKMARYEIGTKLYSWMKERKLTDEDDKRILHIQHPSANALRKLLKVPDSEQTLTNATLNKYVSALLDPKDHLEEKKEAIEQVSQAVVAAAPVQTEEPKKKRGRPPKTSV